MSRLRKLTMALLCLGLATISAQTATETAPQTEQKAAVQTTPRVTEMPEVVVTAVRPGLPLNNLGQSAIVIERQEIAEAGSEYLTDILQEQPGLYYYGYGPRTSTGAVSFRGMNGRHTKLLIDGIPYEDASSTQVVPLFGNIPAALIERIEIVKGPTSLAGSSAMGGVINIITRRPPDDGAVHGELSLSAGSHARMGASAIFYGTWNDLDYMFAIRRGRERGISAVRRSYNYEGKLDNSYGDDDHFRSMDYALRLGYQLDDQWRLSFSGNFSDFDEEYDVIPEDGNIWERHLTFTGRLDGEGLFDGLLDTTLSWSNFRSYRNYVGENSRYQGDEMHLTWQSTLHLNDWNDLTFGLDRETQRLQHWLNNSAGRLDKGDDKRYRVNSGYLSWNTRPVENLSLNFTGRCTHNSDFGTEWTGDISARYEITATNTILHAAFGKSYRQPSLYELVGDLTYYYGAYGYRYYGNPNLSPETNKGWEVGVTQNFLEDNAISVDLTYYQNQVYNYIGSDQTGYTLDNYDAVHIRGAELSACFRWNEYLTIKGGYVWQKQRNFENGNRYIPYIPTHQFTFDATASPLANDKLTLTFGGTLIGGRQNTAGVQMDKYCLLHTAINWKLTHNLEANFRIENLLNSNYQQVATWGPYGTVYNTYGRCYYATMKYSF